MDTSEPALHRLKSKLTRETLWIYILRLLQDKPMYGYEIREYIKDRFDFEPATITAYVVLYKMRKEGLVVTRIAKSPNGRPDRKYYSVTSKGLKLMKEAKVLIDRIYHNVFDKTSGIGEDA
ncbi:MAG: PadR family transcriptional regulator [Candidatus Ranarchaeia archaeon]